MMHYRIGVDVGGTKISIAVLDKNSKNVYLKRVPTPNGDYDRFLIVVKCLISEAKQSVDKSAIYSIGFGIPGELNISDGTVKNANSQYLIDRPLIKDLSILLKADIMVANDATCFVASETKDGAAKNYQLVFGVILGTGVGGGLALNARPWSGVNRVAGEWGHTPFPFFQSAPKNRKCYCGKIDCIEQIISGPSLTLDYYEITNKQISAEKIVGRASYGDRAANELLNIFFENVAKAFSNIINILDPEVIVLGGGLSNINDIYREVPLRWGKYVFHTTNNAPAVKTKLLKNKWGDDSGVRGAAWLQH